MKRKLLPLALTLLISLLLTVPAAAAEYGAIYTEAEALQSDELTDLGKLYLPRFTAFYDTDFRVDVLTGIGTFPSLAEAAAAIYEEYDYGYGEGRDGVSLTMLVHKDEDGVVLDEWYLYAAGDNYELTTNGIRSAVAALNENMHAEDWAGDAEQDTQALVDAINIVSDNLTDFFILDGAADTLWSPEADTEGSDSSAPAVSANTLDSFPPAGESLGYVTDTAQILTLEERQALAQTAQEISEQYDFGVYIIAADDFRDFTDSSAVDDGAVALYQKYDLGLTDENKGILLLLSMDDRDFSLVTYSDYGNYVFDAETREEIASYFLDDFSYDSWYSGFEEYLDGCDWALNEGPDWLQSEINMLVMLIFLIPLIIALVVIAVMSLKMKSVATAARAEEYAADGLVLTNSYDQFTHATETRRKRKTDDSDGGGGSFRSSSSGGFGRTSGKF